MRATNGVTLAVPRGVADLLTTEVTVELLPTERLTGSRLVETIWGDRQVLKSMTFPYERVETFRFFETMCVCLLNVHSEVCIEFDIENSAIHDNRIVLLGALFLRGEDRYKLAQQMDK